MSSSEVLLLKHVDSLGNEGDVVKVAAGYARNYLLPKKAAILATHANRKQIEALQKAREEREKKDFETAKALAEKIEALSVVIAVKTGEAGKLFGSVTANDVLARLKENEIDISKKRLHFAPVKELGQHSVKIKLHNDVEAELKLEIVSENPIEG